MLESEQLLLTLHSRGDTRRFGGRLAACLEPGDLIVLEGDLGAGKTFLARAIARGLGTPAGVRITSPTFDLVHELPARVPLLHVDLYRLDEPAALADLGLEERIGADAVALVEWGDRFFTELGGQGLRLTLAEPSSGLRQCRLEPRGERGRQLFERVRRELARHSMHGRRCPSAA